jgi:4-hydroxybenzoate polyprenyltransferase
MVTFAQRIFPFLQLTRLALVFTAVSNSLCTLLLAAGDATPAGEPVGSRVHLLDVVLIAVVSTGLYGFGMSLNDIIDRRRDRQLAPHRPLPSGRVGVGTAHVVCAALAVAAFVAGAAYATRGGHALMSFLLVGWTLLLIAFYDLAGKYLVWAGLLTLGLIRFFHAVIPAPQLPLLWHPLALLNHTTLLSLVAYAWEEKRPPLTRGHWWAVGAGLGVVNAVAIAAVWWRRGGRAPAGDAVADFARALEVTPALLLPLGAAAAFVAVAWRIRRRATAAREAGQTLMLVGLLWLIVYDVTFTLGHVGPIPALALLLLLPAAYASVQLMRWWGRILTLSQRPAFKRAEG